MKDEILFKCFISFLHQNLPLNNNKNGQKCSRFEAVNYNLKHLIEIYAATKLKEAHNFGVNQQKTNSKNI